MRKKPISEKSLYILWKQFETYVRLLTSGLTSRTRSKFFVLATGLVPSYHYWRSIFSLTFFCWKTLSRSLISCKPRNTLTSPNSIANFTTSCDVNIAAVTFASDTCCEFFIFPTFETLTRRYMNSNRSCR